MGLMGLLALVSAFEIEQKNKSHVLECRKHLGMWHSHLNLSYGTETSFQITAQP